MVGTDLVQAIPLVASAALGHLIFGELEFGLATSVLLGAIPGVYIGARISATANDRYIRPALIAVLTISSLKLIGVSNGWLLAAIIVSVVVIAAYFALRMPAADARCGTARRPALPLLETGSKPSV